jgi:hypothetical protein
MEAGAQLVNLMGAIILTLTYGLKPYCRQRRHWSLRRRREVLLLFVEAVAQLLNLMVAFFTNVYLLIKPCGWSDVNLINTGIVTHTCWNTLFLVTLVRWFLLQAEFSQYGEALLIKN